MQRGGQDFSPMHEQEATVGPRNLDDDIGPVVGYTMVFLICIALGLAMILKYTHKIDVNLKAF